MIGDTHDKSHPKTGMNFEITLEIGGIAFCSGDVQDLSEVSPIRRCAASQDRTNSKQFEEFLEGSGERQTHKCSALSCSEFSCASLIIFCMKAVSVQEASMLHLTGPYSI